MIHAKNANTTLKRRENFVIYRKAIEATATEATITETTVEETTVIEIEKTP